MEIRRIQSKQNFTSINNPIKPFTMKTKHGKILVREMTANELRQKGMIEKLTKLFIKNFVSLTENPDWLAFNDPNKKSICSNIFNTYVKDLKGRLLNPDGNLTILGIFDKKRNLQGACLSYGYDTIPTCKNSVCFIDSLGVNKLYRGEGIGRILVEKTLKSAQKTFTDAFLTA